MSERAPEMDDIVRLLAEHRQRGPADVRWSREELDWLHWWQCYCGYEVRTDQSGPYWLEEHQRRALAAEGLLVTPPRANA